MKKNIVNIFENLARQITDSLEMELVDVEHRAGRGGGPHITVYIDKPGGVFLGDCEKVSKSLGELLDLEDPIPSRYTLEVSSPGVERPLKKAADFSRFKGHDVKIRTREKLAGRQNFKGVLTDFNDDLLTLQTAAGDQIEIKLKEVAKANLYYKNRGRGK
jgi:ribosome maturation factor RimP